MVVDQYAETMSRIDWCDGSARIKDWCEAIEFRQLLWAANDQ